MTILRTADERSARPPLLLVPRVLLALLGVLILARETGAGTPPAPWSRTERRTPCASFETFRQPFFGDTHVHMSCCNDCPTREPN